MLHILGLILKIIGILLLVVLGLVLFLVLSVLFVPFGYCLEGEKQGDDVAARGTAYWFFRLISVRVDYAQKNLSWDLCLFGIPLKRLLHRKGKSREEKTETLLPENIGGTRVAEPAAHILADGEDSVPEKPPVSDSVTAVPQKPENKTAPESRGTDGKEGKGTPKRRETFGDAGPRRSFRERLCAAWDSLCGRIDSWRQKFHSLKEKVCHWQDFLTRESTRRAVSFLLGRGWKILLHLLPRRLDGDVTFGFEDPAATGEALALLSVFYPLYQKRLHLTPYFDRKVLEGHVKIRGRIFVIYLLIQALRVLFNRDVKKTYRFLRRKEA